MGFFDLPFQVYYRAFPDDVSITDRHQIMFSEAILKTKLIKYDYILSLNDTLIFPIHGIQNMKQTIENLRKEENCWMLFDNNEKIYLVSTFSNSCITKFITCRDIRYKRWIH